MFQSTSTCRLCLNIGHDLRELYDKDGHRNEVYALTEKYFTPMLLNLEDDRHLAAICVECWRHIFEFHTFQQTIHLAHRSLSNRAEFDGVSERVSPGSEVTEVEDPNKVCLGVSSALNVSHDRGTDSCDAEDEKGEAVSPINDISSRVPKIIAVRSHGELETQIDENDSCNAGETEFPLALSPIVPDGHHEEVETRSLEDLKDISVWDVSIDCTKPSFDGDESELEAEVPIVPVDPHGAVEAESPEDLKDITVLDFPIDCAKASFDGGESEGEAEVPTVPDEHHEEIEAQSLEDFKDITIMDFSLGDGNEAEGEVPLATTEILSNFPKPIEPEVEGPKIKDETESTELENASDIEIGNQQSPTILKSEAEEPVINVEQHYGPIANVKVEESQTKSPSIEDLPDRGNESKESSDPDEECEEYDEPVGVFAGGEFDRPTRENEESQSEETESVTGSDWSLGSFGSDDEEPLAAQTRRRKTAPKKQVTKKATSETSNAKGKKKKRNSHAKDSKRHKSDQYGDGTKSDEFGGTFSSDDGKRRKRNSHAKDSKRLKTAQHCDGSESEEFGGTFSSDDERRLAECVAKTKGPNTEENTGDKSMDRETIEENLPSPSKPLDTPGNSKRVHKTALEFDESASEEGDYSSGEDASATKSSGDDGNSQTKSKAKYKKRTKFSYKTSLKRLKTVEEFDDFIAQWRPNLECVSCRETCSSFSLLQQHFAQQHPREECHIMCCQHKFYHRYEIERHIHYHNEPHAFKCEVCFKCFTQGEALRDHLRTKHGGAQRESFKCPQCDRCYSHSKSLKKHMRYACNGDKNLTAEQAAKGHVCGECGKAYKHLNSLRLHEKCVHLKSVPKCTICDKIFYSQRDLQQHMNNHLGKLTHTCPFCSKMYATNRPFYEHLRRMHPKEWEEKKKEKAERSKEKKIYKCDTCAKEYQTPLALNEHNASHTGKVMYSCKLCPKTYKYSSNVAAHVKRVHSKEQQAKKNKKKD